MVEGSISSHLDNDSGPESKEQAEALTPEDIAWIDSCLIEEVPDISDGNWNLMKDALLKVLDLYPQGFESSLALSDNIPGGTTDDDDVDMLLFNDVKEPSFPLRNSDDLMNESGIASEDPQNNDGGDSSLSLSFSREGIDFALLLSNNAKDPTLFSRDSNDPMNDTVIATEDQQNHDDIDSFLSFSSNKNPFLPTYKEEETIQTGSSNDLSETESEPRINDIFRVWDLNLPPVEDELAEQLNKALSVNSAKSVPSMDGNLSVLRLRDSKEDLLDDLINSISDLSLKQNKIMGTKLFWSHWFLIAHAADTWHFRCIVSHWNMGDFRDDTWRLRMK